MASASRGKTPLSKDTTEQFCGITGASEEIAARLLEACKGNLEMAIGMHMDGAGGGLPAAVAVPPPASPTSACGSASHQATADEEAVRAPIPQRREVLVQDVNTNFGNIDVNRRRRAARSVFDGLRDFQAEARQQEQNQAQSHKSTKQKTLEDLFRPPIDLMFKGSFHAARDAGSAGNRWLMVNIQNAREFACQMLNRDVWSNSAVKAIINRHFIFWQVYNDSEEGRKYMQFYKIHQWPYLAVLDPRTGENVRTWNNVDAISLCDLITEFLSEHDQPDGAFSPEGPPAKRARKDTLVDASEDSQLQAAIQASMHETKAADPVIVVSDVESGSEAELETFTDSEEEQSSATPLNCMTIDSNSSASNQSVQKPEVSEVLVVSESSSSSVSSVSLEPSSSLKKVPTNKPIEPSSSHQTASSLAPSTENKQLNSTKHSPPSTAITPICSDNGTSGHKKDCINGSSDKVNSNSSSSNSSSNSSSSCGISAGINNSTTPKKFQFVQQSESTSAQLSSSWRDHLGSKEDLEAVINIRFPDGKRQQFRVPCSTKLRALIMFIQEEGYHKEMYELVTNFPKRRLSYLDVEDTLKNHGLFPQETVFVQER